MYAMHTALSGRDLCIGGATRVRSHSDRWQAVPRPAGRRDLCREAQCSGGRNGIV